MSHSASNLPTELAPLGKYLADEEILGFKFSYPSQYLESIAWAHRDIDDGGDGHELAFLVRDEIATELKFFVRSATREPLVPFARGGNGDELYCFSGKKAGQVYVIGLGEKRLKARDTGCGTYLDFLNWYRANLDLPPWAP